MEKQLIHPMNDTYHTFLQDESKLVGAAESISFPKTEQEISQILRVMRVAQTPITIQGGKTGLVGSAVPSRGHIMNLGGMDRVQSFFVEENGQACLRVEPGLTLDGLRKYLNRLDTSKTYFWPPDPSELSATIGGIAATDAKGLCHYLYGDTSAYISGMRVMGADGSARELTRGKETIVINGENVDLLDVYIGGEGMFGVITALTLCLLEKPLEIWGICFFFNYEEAAMSFADDLITKGIEIEGANIATLEFLDQTIISKLADQKGVMSRLKSVPDIPAGMSAMTYVEIHGQREDAMQKIATKLMTLNSMSHGNPDNTWAFSGEPEMDRIRAFLHAAEETINMQIEKVRCLDQRITKLDIDVGIKQLGLKKWINRLRKDTQKKNLRATYWAHMGSHRLHIDIIPRDFTEFEIGRTLLEHWAQRYPEPIGAAITAYGIGKSKKSILPLVVYKAHMRTFQQLKNQLDKENFWNPNNIIGTRKIL